MEFRREDFLEVGNGSGNSDYNSIYSRGLVFVFVLFTEALMVKGVKPVVLKLRVTTQGRVEGTFHKGHIPDQNYSYGVATKITVWIRVSASERIENHCLKPFCSGGS